MKPRIKKTIINIFLSFVSFLIFLGIFEIVLRTTHLFNARISWAEPDPILGWRNTPSRKYWFREETDHPIIGRINSYGWRDKEWSLQKPNKIYRIAVLGDSFVEAFHVESDRTFLALTEYQLNGNQDIKVELMNFGRSGCTQTEELLVLKNDVMPFSPDMVIVFFYPINDIKDINRETTTDLTRPFYHISESRELMLDTSFVEMREFRIKCFVNWFKQHSVLISLLCERYNSYKIQMRFRAKNTSNSTRGEALPKKLEDYLSLCTDEPDATFLGNYQLNKRLIKAIAENCKEKGICFMLVTINNNAYIPKVEKQYKLIDSTFDTNFFEDDLGNYAKSISIEYLGLQRIFRQSFEKTGIPLHWDHWNYEGHKLVAYSLANKLRSIIYSKE